MDSHMIKTYLERYFEGQTTLAEEEALKEYFSRDDLPAAWREYRSFFQPLVAAQQEKAPVSREELSRYVSHGVRQHSWRWYISVSTAVAASIALMISIFNYEMGSRKNPALAARDTYQDPVVAYQETQKALQLIADKLNKGTQPLNHLSRFGQAQNLVTEKH